MTPIPHPREMKRVVDALVEAENQVLKLRAEYAAMFAVSEAEDDGGGKGTIGERILELLSSRCADNFTAQQVATTLDAKLSSVGPNLSRLVSEGKIRKVGHGEYRGITPPLQWSTPIAQEDLETEDSPVAVAS